MVRASDMAKTDPRAAGSAGLLKLIRRSGDANLGQTLMRLAARAAAEHRAQADAPGAADEGEAAAREQEVRR